MPILKMQVTCVKISGRRSLERKYRVEGNHQYDASSSRQPTAPKRRPGGRSARIRAAVMDATMEMLKERELEEFNVAEIAARVGVHESTIYRRWGSRDGSLIT